MLLKESITPVLCVLNTAVDGLRDPAMIRDCQVEGFFISISEALQVACLQGLSL